MKKRSVGLADFALRYVLVTVVVIAIVYGSLYPFAFRDTGSLGSDLLHLVGTWNQPFHSRGDTLANLLLYMPLGLTMALASNRHRLVALAVAAMGGAILSLAIELAQFYDASRVSTLSDVYLNVAGTLTGAIVAWLAGTELSKLSWPRGSSPAFARFLILAWLGWRLYPYVPTIDLHKYWHSVQPLFVAHVAATSIFRYALLWLSVAFLLQTGLAPKRPMRLLLPAMLCFFAAKVLVIGQILSLPEILGAALAALLSGTALKRHARIGVPALAVLLLLLIVLTRVLPWHIATAPKAFQWVPFFSFLRGGPFQLISLAEKFYLYGVVLLLLVTAGMKFRTAVILECGLLLSTSVLQIFMVDRSAEITDAVVVLVLGLIYAFLRQQYGDRTGAARHAGR